MSKFILGKRSADNLVGVHPKLVAVVKRALELSPVDLTVIEGVRSVERQKQLFNVGRLVTTDTGGTYVGYLDTPVTPAPYVTIGEVHVVDTRGTKATDLFQLDSGNALNFVVSEIRETSGIPLATWGGADKYLKTSAYRYLCQGTPLNMIPAPVGSIATRIDGGASTTLYVKESGTGSTGWAAK